MNDNKKTKKQLIAELDELRKKESIFTKAFHSNTAPMAISTLKEGRFTNINDEFVRVLGYDRNEVIGKTSKGLNLYWDDTQRDKIIRAMEKSGYIRNIEILVRTKRGKKCYGLFSAEKMSVGNDEFLFTLFRDITKRKQTEMKLRESEEDYRTLIESNPYGFQVIDVSGHITYSNPAYQKMLGYTTEELLGKSILDLLDCDETRVKLRSYLSMLIKDQPEPTTYIQKNRTRDGKIIDQLVDWDYKRDNEGRVIGFASIITDVTELKLAEKQLHFHSEIMKNLTEGVYVIGADDGIIGYCNPIFESMFGYGPGEMSGKHVSIINAPTVKSPDEVAKEIMGILNETGEWHGEVNNIKKDGTSFWCYVSCSMLNHPELGRVIVTVQTDITDHKRAEEALRESEERFRKIFEKGPLGMVFVDQKFRYVKINKIFCEMMGYSEQELSSLTFKDITHPEDIEKNTEHVKKLFSGKIPLYKTEKRYIKKNKEILWASTIVSVVRDDNGKFLYYLAMVEDITKRKQAEDQLRKSEEKFRKYINHAPAAIFIVDGQGRHIECNQAAYKLSGYSESEHKNMSIPDMADPKEQQNLIESFENLKKTGYDSSEITLKRKDGKVICISLDAVKLSEDRFMSFCSDITETKRLQALESRAERLETAGTIAGQVAHDFNNLLAPLIVYPEFIRDELPVDHPAKIYLDRIEEAAQKMADINQDLLTMGRRGYYNQKVLNLNTIVKQAISGLKPLSETLAIKIDLCHDLMNFLGGSAQINRVIINLLNNAMESMQDNGQITVKTENYYVDDNSIAYGRVPKGEYIKLTISDTGHGISDDIMQKIFDPFFTTKTADRKRGSGLGMSVVDAVINDHNGYIDLTTKVGEGTSFYIYLPVIRESMDSQNLDLPYGGSETILVIDDDKFQREVSENLLKKLGYKVTVVESGEKAVEFLKKNPQDLLILDMVMPEGMDGTETYRQILKINPSQKAIIVSGFSESDRVLVVQKMGVKQFIKKPFTAEIMATAIRNELDTK